MNNYQRFIDLLATDEYYKIKQYTYFLINDKNFIDIIVKVHNPIVFDRFIKMAEYKIDTAEIHEKRNIFIRKKLLSLNKNEVNEFFNLNNYPESSQEMIANRYLAEYIVSYYFQDNYYNFMVNLYQMIGYLRQTKKDLIEKKHIELYEKFVELKNMSFEDKISLFKSHLQDNLMELFYDDINIVREDSHKNLVDNSLKLSKDSAIYQSDISRRAGVDVYYLDGESFYGFVRCLSHKASELLDAADYVFSKKGRLGYSFSYIGANDIGTSDYNGQNVTLFYDNINYKNIMYVHHGDMHSKKMSKQYDYVSDKENEIITPDNLIAKTNNYNEVYIKPNSDGIKPTAIVCYNRINGNDLAFAERYNLAILLINLEKYKRFQTYDDDYNSYSYII